MNELSIVNQYPAEKYNLLGNTEVMVDVPDIKSPVVQAVKLNPDPKASQDFPQMRELGNYAMSISPR